MVSHIAWFEYIICESEIEALVLECNLIKEHRPHYNTMLTDDKSYPYIKITVNEDFPRILFSHQMHRDHARYFGPYTNAGAVKDTIDLLKKLYHLRSCNKSYRRKQGWIVHVCITTLGNARLPVRDTSQKRTTAGRWNRQFIF